MFPGIWVAHCFLFYRYQNGTNGVASFRVSLKVGTSQFFGEAISAQAAKHNAAMNALKIIKVIHPDHKLIFQNDSWDPKPGLVWNSDPEDKSGSQMFSFEIFIQILDSSSIQNGLSVRSVKKNALNQDWLEFDVLDICMNSMLWPGIQNVRQDLNCHLNAGQKLRQVHLVIRVKHWNSKHENVKFSDESEIRMSGIQMSTVLCALLI